MAIDSARKRGAALATWGVPGLVLPVPTSGDDILERAQLAFGYETPASSLAPNTVGLVTPFLVSRLFITTG